MTDDHAAGTASLEVGTKQLRGEEVRSMDITLCVPDAILEDVEESMSPGTSRETHPGVFRDRLNERIRWEYTNLDLPDRSGGAE